MKLVKSKSRTYKGKKYYRYRVGIPESAVKKAAFKEGQELKVEAKKGEVRLRT